MFTTTLSIAPEEYWYGLAVLEGGRFPLHAGSEYRYSIDPNPGDNQAAPLLLSSQGRYLWSSHGFALEAANGQLTASSAKAEIVLGQGGQTLREAFCAAAQKHIKPNGKLPPLDFFQKPQYNSWIELIYNQNQQDILTYARQIVDNGLPPGILMIDDSWAEYYGRWEFNRRTFPTPREMVEQLHNMGFTVMLWVCPFVSPDSLEFRQLEAQGLLVRDAQGQTAIRSWWNGWSAVLDMSNPQAAHWLEQQLRHLMQAYGVDGYKFDAGDALFYRDDDQTYAPTDANGQTALWAQFGQRFAYNEFRAGFACQGVELVQRLADRTHSWDSTGLASLVPNQLAQGILGYAFTCPDMIGGGQYGSFVADSFSLDEELFVRYAQCSALMPMMQFSAAPWRVLSPPNAGLCIAAAALHHRFAATIVALARQAAVSCEPIVRYMEYQFPHQGLADVTDQFMLGEDILVAPVLRKGDTGRRVRLPAGSWRYCDGTVFAGGQTVQVAAPLDVLPYFEAL